MVAITPQTAANDNHKPGIARLPVAWNRRRKSAEDGGRAAMDKRESGGADFGRHDFRQEHDQRALDGPHLPSEQWKLTQIACYQQLQ